jgi:dTDP-4-amino-4,6-dideoxygalactose transaminase
MMIPYSHQSIDEDDLKAVRDVLQSDAITGGPEVRRFEEAFAAKVKARYAVAVNSGTAALHIAYLAAGLSEGDELLTTPMTFAATSNAALYCGAKPVFADILPGNGLLDPEQARKKFTKKTKIVVPVHYAGQPADLQALRDIDPKVIIVEDACHALGARYRDSTIGDCRYSDMAVFSFHPVKHITTGEGGMVTTNSEELRHKLLLLRSHGIEKDPERFVR